MKSKGFTLLEVIIYIGVSSLIMTSLFGFLLTTIELQAKISTDAETELDGIYWLQTLENNIKNHQTIASSSLQHLTNVVIQTSVSTTTISFSIDTHDFSSIFSI